MKYALKPSACEGCPAFDSGLGFVEPSPRAEAPVVLVLDGPDELAARFSQSINWRSGAGKGLLRWLKASEVGPVSLTNVVRCYMPARYEAKQPKGKRSPTKAEADFCRAAHLEPTLKELLDGRQEPTVIVTVGTDAARAVRGLEGPVEPSLGTFTDRVSVSRGPDS